MSRFTLTVTIASLFALVAVARGDEPAAVPVEPKPGGGAAATPADSTTSPPESRLGSDFGSGGGGFHGAGGVAMGLPASAIPGRNWVAGTKVIVTFSEDGKQVLAYSEQHPHWVAQDLEQVADTKPVPVVGDGDTVAVRVGHLFYAYSATLGKWDVLELPPGEVAAPVVGDEGVNVHSASQGDFVFKDSWGKWFSTDEIKAGRVAEHMLAQREAAPADPGESKVTQEVTVFYLKYVEAKEAARIVRQLFGGKLNPAVEERTNSLIVASDDPLVVKRAEELLKTIDSPVANDVAIDVRSDVGVADVKADELRGKLAELEQRTRELAARLRGPLFDPATGDRFKEELRDTVKQAFEARQNLQCAELAEFAQRLRSIQQSIEMRDRISQQIIVRRVEELLNPALRWESKRVAEEPTVEPTKPVAKGVSEIQGHWRLEGLMMPGVPMGPPPEAQDLIVAGETWAVIGQETTKGGHLLVDATTNPKAMTFIATADGRRDKALAIYRLKDGCLEILTFSNGSTQRPASFNEKNACIQVWRRVVDPPKSAHGHDPAPLHPVPRQPVYRGGTFIPGGVVPIVPGSVVSVERVPDETLFWQMFGARFLKVIEESSGVVHPAGLQITELRSNGPAERAGLRVGDIVVHIGLQPIAQLKDVNEAWQESVGNSDPPVIFVRGKNVLHAKIKWATIPSPPLVHNTATSQPGPQAAFAAERERLLDARETLLRELAELESEHPDKPDDGESTGQASEGIEAMRRKLASERIVALQGLLVSRLEEVDEKLQILAGQQASLQDQGEVPPDRIPDSDQTHIQKAMELRKTIADLVADVASYEAVVQHNPQHDDIGGITKRLETARRDLILHRDELATRIQLLELQLQDAQSAADVAAKTQERLFELNKAAPRPISQEIIHKARRDYEIAQWHVQRIGALVELYRKTDSSDELPLQVFQPEDASSASQTVGIVCEVRGDFDVVISPTHQNGVELGEELEINRPDPTNKDMSECFARVRIVAVTPTSAMARVVASTRVPVDGKNQFPFRKVQVGDTVSRPIPDETILPADGAIPADKSEVGEPATDRESAGTNTESE